MTKDEAAFAGMAFHGVPCSALPVPCSPTFDDPATQSRLGRLYQDALTDLIEINTVPADPAAHNVPGS